MVCKSCDFLFWLPLQILSLMGLLLPTRKWNFLSIQKPAKRLSSLSLSLSLSSLLSLSGSVVLSREKFSRKYTPSLGTRAKRVAHKCCAMVSSRSKASNFCVPFFSLSLFEICSFSHLAWYKDSRDLPGVGFSSNSGAQFLSQWFAFCVFGGRGDGLSFLGLLPFVQGWREREMTCTRVRNSNGLSVPHVESSEFRLLAFALPYDLCRFCSIGFEKFSILFPLRWLVWTSLPVHAFRSCLCCSDARCLRHVLTVCSWGK